MKSYRVTDKPLYFVNSLEDLRRYETHRETLPSNLCVWIKNQNDLNNLAEPAKKLNAQFLFSYNGLRPSEIVKMGDFRGPEDLELPDPRIRDESLFLIHPQVLQQSKVESPQVSVIIPVFDNQRRALKALSCWLNQNLREYEIILVDDGSEVAWLKDLVGQHTDTLTLLQLARPGKRRRGDHNFRAGLARNAGFEIARGSELIFCDSDILVPPNALQWLSEELKDADVVMPHRWQLSSEASEQFTTYEKINFNRDVVLSPGAFWESFQTQKRPWMEQENYWRWTSTFLLGVRREALLKAGLFKKSFVTYGFEDTELGLRLHKLGHRFHLSSLKAYHLHQSDELSEYKNDLGYKKRLLRISADRLFRHHPSKEVYEIFKTWLD